MLNVAPRVAYDGAFMPLDDFHGQTFVAFTDISGFRALMRTRREAFATLRTFYANGYRLLRTNRSRSSRVEGLFVSDCAILFVRSRSQNRITELRSLLAIVEKLNRQMLRGNRMLTTSIALGNFHYLPRAEFQGIEKNLIGGKGYIEAYIDNSSGMPKLTPGQCRILETSLRVRDLPENDRYFARIIRGKSGYLFYWMCDDRSQIRPFDANYRRARNFDGILRALKLARAAT